MTAIGVGPFHPKRHLSLLSTWFLLFSQNEGGKEEVGRLGWRRDAEAEADMLGDDKEHEEKHSDTE